MQNHPPCLFAFQQESAPLILPFVPPMSCRTCRICGVPQAEHMVPALIISAKKPILQMIRLRLKGIEPRQAGSRLKLPLPGPGTPASSAQLSCWRESRGVPSMPCLLGTCGPSQVPSPVLLQPTVATSFPPSSEFLWTHCLPESKLLTQQEFQLPSAHPHPLHPSPSHPGPGVPARSALPWAFHSQTWAHTPPCCLKCPTSAWRKPHNFRPLLSSCSPPR